MGGKLSLSGGYSAMPGGAGQQKLLSPLVPLPLKLYQIDTHPKILDMLAPSLY